LARPNGHPKAITLDYTNKQVYWIEVDLNFVNKHIFSSDYDFQHQESIRNGSFGIDMLSIFGNSLYFQKDDVFSINQMNVSNGNMVRSILVDKATYYGLIAPNSSQQHMGM
jgi:hypothetical protein